MEKTTRLAHSFAAKYSWIFTTLAVVCSLIAGFYSGFEGDSDRLSHGVDVSGALCTGDTPYAYFPKPTNSTNVVFCVPGCPLTTTPEGICSHDRSFQCYDSYPSKPYYGYCLPAASDKREAVLSYLRDSDVLFTNVLADVYSSFFGEEWTLMVEVWALGLAPIVLMLCVVGACGMKWRRPLWGAYGVALLSVLSSCAVFCYVFYTEPERSNSRLCDSYASVEMADCRESYPWYTAIFLFLIAASVLILSSIGNKSPALHRGLMFLYAACADSANRLRPVELLLAAYCLGVGVVYLGFLAAVYLGSCWVEVLRVLPDEYQSEVQGRDFRTVTRILVALPVVTMCLCLFEVSRLLRKKASRVQPRNAENNPDLQVPREDQHLINREIPNSIFREIFISTVQPYSATALRTFQMAVGLWLPACALLLSAGRELHFMWVPAACVVVLAGFSSLIVRLAVARVMHEAVNSFLLGEELEALKERLGFPTNPPLPTTK